MERKQSDPVTASTTWQGGSGMQRVTKNSKTERNSRLSAEAWVPNLQDVMPDGLR